MLVELVSGAVGIGIDEKVTGKAKQEALKEGANQVIEKGYEFIKSLFTGEENQE